ncbi:MAG TPA: hypothetical protein PKY78_05325 [Candidatus Omnitrophota bacterium]|nr:hypothetical protein [Candidatus Omnitrophota bacterium]
MKIGKIIIAAIALSLFGMIAGGLTCGWLFNWVYKLEPINIWKPMQGPPGLMFNICAFLLNMALVIVYALFQKGIPGKNKLAKGLIFGSCIWAVGILPGMFTTYSFMTISTGVVIYWTILGLIEMPIKGLIISVIYGE